MTSLILVHSGPPGSERRIVVPFSQSFGGETKVTRVSFQQAEDHKFPSRRAQLAKLNAVAAGVL
jgi:hypothetical protein